MTRIRATTVPYRSIPILVRKIHPNARMPQQSDGDVGFDIFCVEDVVLKARAVTHVGVGLELAEAVEPLLVDDRVVAVPFIKVEGRSGLASKGIFPVGGIIDPRYRGEIGCLLYNSNEFDYVFEKGDRIAQFVVYYTLSSVGAPMQVRFLATDNVAETDRGSKGFGSTGR